MIPSEIRKQRERRAKRRAKRRGGTRNTMPGRIVSYKREVRKWVTAGKPERGDDDVVRLYRICAECNHWADKRRQCGICGCRIRMPKESFFRLKAANVLIQSLAISEGWFNKLRMATTACPDKPPKWNAEHP